MNTNKSNELVALEWLLGPLNEQMNAIHTAWQQAQTHLDYEQFNNEFHAIGNVLKLANLNDFANLAYALNAAVNDLSTQALGSFVAPKILYASQLLQHELNRFVVTGFDNKGLIALKTHYIHHLSQVRTNGVDEVDMVADGRFSEQLPKINEELLRLNQDNYKKLSQAFRYATDELLKCNHNHSEHLGNLIKVIQYLRQGTNDHALKNLWRMTILWLASLMVNDKPTPEEYAHLLAELDKIIHLQPSLANDVNTVIWLENILIDIYVQLSQLQIATEETHELLSLLSSSIVSEQAFFPHILAVLEGVIFSLARGEIFVEVLEEIKDRLEARGWAFYESYVGQIIEDVKSSYDDPQLFSQMQWQINTQLQDLYAAIKSTHDSIESKIGESVAALPNPAEEGIDPLRRVRILVEEIKFAFNEYLHNKDLNSLPDESKFIELDQIFGDMGMYDVAQMATKFANLFGELYQQNPERVSWQFAHALADCLSLLELFLDSLAKQVFDNALLTRASDQLDVAIDVIAKDPQDEFDDTKVLDDQIRYDDTGEIILNQTLDGVIGTTDAKSIDDRTSDSKDSDDSQLANTDNQKTADQPLSEHYLLAKQSLKADDFDFDEDIRDIFIEEAQEVLDSMDDLLPAWQKNPNNPTPLKDIRRNFHTLKGSGRMVGALSVGEMAWAIEDMLNRVLDGTIAYSNQIAQLIGEATAVIPTLVADFANKTVPSIDPAVIILKAHNIIAGRAIDEGLPQFEEHAADDISQAQITQAQITDNTQSAVPDVLLPFIADAKQPPSSVNTDDIDDDIKEIFIEEANEVLEEITPLFAQWQNHRTDMATLTAIRRGFHTLKGSGRMVGAGQLGELAWSIENMLNRVLDGTIAVNDGMVALVQAVLDGFGELVALFEAGLDTYPDTIFLQIAAAHAYSKGLGDGFDYRHLHDKNQANKTADSQADQANDKALNSLQEAKQALSNATLTEPNTKEELRLCDTFIEEARGLLATVKSYIQDHQNQDEVPVSDEIVRAFHTMRGALGLSPLVVVGEVGTMIESGLADLQKDDAMMTAKHMQALATSVALIESHLDGYESNLTGEGDLTHLDELAEEKERIHGLFTEESTNANRFEVAQLIDGIDGLLDAELELEGIAGESEVLVKEYAKVLLAEIDLLESRTSQSGKFQRVLGALSRGYQALYHHPSWASDDELIDRLLACHGELTALFDSLAGSMSLRVNDKNLHALDNKVADIQEYYRTQNNTQAKIQALTDTAVDYQEISTDDDLLEIFLEEAAELDESIGKAFGAWRDDTNNTEALKELQRYLHTVKGGARLAGISSIGDLTHEAETIYEQMVDGRLVPSVGWVRVMQSVQDILSLQIDEVRQNKRSFFATQAVAELQALLASGEVASDAQITLPILKETDTADETASTKTSDGESVAPKSDFEIRQQRSWQGHLPNEEILAVFLEEAEEIVESSTEDFQVFKNNTGDIATLQQLQRKLHTIKGGARMVSANGVADLAHNMETVYEGLGNRTRPSTKMVTQLLLACHDWLTQAMTLLKAKLNPPRPTPLIEALEQFSRRPDSLVEVPVVTLSDELEAIAIHEAYEKQRRGGHDISRMPPMSGLFSDTEETANSSEMIRISSGLMERMINLSGEAAINRARIDMSMASLTASIEEMGSTVQRLHDQLRRMDIELEAQILAQIDDTTWIDSGEFDPLEMDQYSSLNQLSKSLSESASDLLDLKATLLEKTRDGENLLLQLSRTQNELQDGLMNSRMVPFSRLTPRLQRIVRQISAELGKSIELSIVNADDEMDRTILDRITSPLEHMLRNAIDHGIELPDERVAMGKSRTGHIVLEVVREGSEILIHLTDDGAGINVDAVRKKAISQGLINANDTSLSDVDIMQYIFNAGLSTTSVVTQISGRGVGMDVVRSEIRQLGGSVSVDSVRGQGSKFTMRVPLTVAVSDALIVRAADRHYGVPLVQIERVTQVSPKELLDYYQSSQNTMTIDGHEYRLRYLNEILSGHNFSEILNANVSLPVIIIKNQAGQNLALQVDEIVGSRIEMVVKPLGRQLSHVAGISAATIMGDGSVMLILDLMALMRNAQARVAVQIEAPTQNRRPVILVVDDSVTVRKVTSRFLDRQGFEAVVAKDGVDAIEILQELTPDLMLLDIEMPRMDGFEVATQVRHSHRLKELPIIMITSRTGEKHRERAFEIGVNDYMGKPFQENELLNRIMALLPQQT